MNMDFHVYSYERKGPTRRLYLGYTLRMKLEDLERHCFKVTHVCLPLECFCMTQGYLHPHSKTPELFARFYEHYEFHHDSKEQEQ